MNIKNLVVEKREKRPQTMCIRRKSIKVKPLDLFKDNESPLLSRVSLYQQKIQEKQIPTKSVAQYIPVQSLGHEFEKINKIYNKTDNFRKIQSLGMGDRIKFPRASVNYLCSTKNDVILQLETRPKSSQNKKFTQSNQIFKNNNDVLNYQNRPGSSKSSRVFKRKVEIENDPLNVENQQFDGLIRVTTINGGSRFKNTKYFSKNRINTAVNPLQRIEKLPQKIDPQFYRLFAQ